MRILFIENRSATWLWAEVAKRLSRQGHEIHWLVQNRLFKPDSGKAHTLSMPNEKDMVASSDIDPYMEIRAGDRGVLHFGLEGNHYRHFDLQIGAVFDDIRPDVVFGEVTQFQELLAIRHSRRHKIPYLSPSGTRYPVNRMCFFVYDTLDPIGGEGKELSDADAEDMLSAITERKIVPSYMLKIPSIAWKSKFLRAYSHSIVLASWMLGERYITPSPLRKIFLERTRARIYKCWESVAVRKLPHYLANAPWVLYPLQMQPESNIDVWGRPWNDQCEIIERSARALLEIGGYLVVKPNPKSKYELSEALCNLAKKNSNIIFMSHDVSMREIFKSAPLVLTVTGTVLMECIFAGKPIACLGTHSMSRYPGVTALQMPEEIAAILQEAQLGNIVGATRAEAIALLKFLYRTSYPAQIWDPITRPDLTNSHEIDVLSNAFMDVLKVLEKDDTQVFRQELQAQPA
jgi:hypothetical protein